VAGVDVFGSIENWASSAWGGLQSVGGSFYEALNRVWHLTASIVAGLGWVVMQLVSPGTIGIYQDLQAVELGLRTLRDALDRVAWWVWTYMILPVRADLQIQIFLVRAQLLIRIQLLTNLVWILYQIERAYTIALVGQERQQRIADIASARAYAKALTTQLHQTIEAEAVAGYRAGQGVRSTLLQQLAEDLHLRGILDRVSTDLLIKAIGTVVTIDDPVLGAAANRIIGLIIRKSGIGADLGDLIDRLINPGAGGAAPRNLTGVIADITHRLGQIEDWITKFELDGGPELRDAGKQMKTMNGLLVDAALVAFFAQAVAAPEAWAREVSDTVGTVANDTIGGIMRLINHR
jgi:hypothetical protein